MVLAGPTRTLLRNIGVGPAQSSTLACTVRPATRARAIFRSPVWEEPPAEDLPEPLVHDAFESFLQARE
eukprot:6832989-Lingulodinium_polyedra.AAC.1